MGKKRRWTDAALQVAVVECYSMASVLRMLGLKVRGANYDTVRRRISDLNLDHSHWTGKGYRKGCTTPVKAGRPISEVLQRGSRCCTNGLRQRLLREGYFSHVCQICAQATWMGRSIPLELDHIDGDRENNLIENLRLICPNCHAQTVNYRGRNTRYDHIPSLMEIEAGIKRCGTVRAYAIEQQVHPNVVRGWLSSPRLKALADRDAGNR
jgi:HNH endonuclease